jgi:hypothetical protein
MEGACVTEDFGLVEFDPPSLPMMLSLLNRVTMHLVSRILASIPLTLQGKRGCVSFASPGTAFDSLRTLFSADKLSITTTRSASKPPQLPRDHGVQGHSQHLAFSGLDRHLHSTGTFSKHGSQSPQQPNLPKSCYYEHTTTGYLR